YRSVTASIRNLSGQLIASQQVKNTDKLNIVLDGPKAYYLIEIQTKEGKSAVLKVLKE
ncbi:MAG: T9SS type A sorting domain-containing protein, partial [Bacteroidetes bacterium]|nr:T9SS type A sorting domain-containing protein [Bacteroidota bacterium]